MRALYSRYAMKTGFTSSDVERSASETCDCDLHVVPVSIVRRQTPSLVNVRVTSYDHVRVRIVDVPDATPAQRERRRLWLIASPNG
jgi:hypothetical protein